MEEGKERSQKPSISFEFRYSCTYVISLAGQASYVWYLITRPRDLDRLHASSLQLDTLTFLALANHDNHLSFDLKGSISSFKGYRHTGTYPKGKELRSSPATGIRSGRTKYLAQ